MVKIKNIKTKCKITYTENQEKIIQYLKECVANGGTYFKSKHIAKDLNMSSKEVGANMCILEKNCDDLKITRYAYSLGTTWQVNANPF